MPRRIVRILVLALLVPGAVVSAPRPADALLGQPPDPVSNFGTGVDPTGLTLFWTNPTVVDWTDTVVRVLPGTTAPAAVTDGVQLYAGTGTQVLVSGLRPATTYSFSVFSRNSEGLASTPVSRTLNGLEVILKKATDRAFGLSARLVGTIRDVETGEEAPFANQATAVNPETGHVTPFPGGGAGNSINIPVTPDRTYDWYVVVWCPKYNGRWFMPGVSNRQRLTINAVLTAEVTGKGVVAGKASYLAPAGKAVTFAVTGKPVSTTAKLVLQEQVSGRWKTLLKGFASSGGVAKFTVKPSKGPHRYRVKRSATPASGAGSTGDVVVRAA